MNIYIPSRSRFERSLTLNAVVPPGKPSAWPRERVHLVVPLAQRAAYAGLAKRHGINVLGCKQNGIARTRQFIGQVAGTKFLMLDDDLRFFNRPPLLAGGTPNDKAKLFKIEDVAQLTKLFSLVDDSLDSYVHVAIGAREGNQNLPYPFEVNNRPLRALAYRRKEFLACEHGRVAIMEDFDVTLQLIKKGYSNKIITNYVQDQTMTQMAGGCSDYRTHELHQANVLKMVELHAPFVVPREKENKFGGEFGKRTEATIYWKKRWAATAKEVGLA